jgi:NosR/NirI family nitrous oxide reductase transcriptional regulator
MDRRPRTNGRLRLLRHLLPLVLLAGALVWGRSHRSPDWRSAISELYPEAGEVRQQGQVFQVLGPSGMTLGWAGTGRAGGYGGPLLLVAGIDTLGRIVGARVVEQRETPVFWRMVRSPAYFDAVTGSPFGGVDYDYHRVVGVTGATRSSEAIAGALQVAVARAAAAGFEARLPQPAHPFEFGLLEVTVLALLTAALTAHRIGGRVRRRVRWVCQLVGLVVVGFWKASPLSLAKMASLGSGFFPDPRTAMAFYLLLAAFLITSAVHGRNIYCLYVCPFGAAQRCIGIIGGGNLKVPGWLTKSLMRLRDLTVFTLLFAAFLTLQPELAAYEPFSALFSLHGTTLQWLLLAVVLVTSLAVHTPWCDYLCPMRTFEVFIQQVRDGLRPRAPTPR